MPVVGASVCLGSWFAVRIDDDHERPADGALYPDLAGLFDAWGDAALVLVGMPIGLPDARRPTRRSFSEARARLTPLRHNSVSPVPSRAVIEAVRSDKARTYEDMSELNDRELGKRLSKQSFAMVSKIAELGAFLLSHSEARAKTREAHRELCFWGLNGGRPMAHAKRRPEGIAERLAVLCGYLPWTRAFCDDVRRESARGVPVAVVVDALAPP